MEANRKFKRATASMLVALAGCSGEVPTHTTKQVNAFGTEEQAAYEGSLNRPASVPVFTLASGAAVEVLDDTYGKDYWACYVRTENAQEGWVLCTSLDYKRSGGA
jgi:hypothetical protein